MIIHILSHVHFQTTFSVGPRWPPLNPKHLGQEIEPQQFQHTDGTIFWMKDMFVGWFCAALSWWFFLISCLSSLHSLNVARALIALKFFFVVGRGARNFSWPVTPNCGPEGMKKLQAHVWAPHRFRSGIIKLPTWGDQTLQLYGKFEGFPWISTEQCIVWVGNIINPVDETRGWRIWMDTQKVSPSFIDWFNQGGSAKNFPRCSQVTPK